MGPRWFIPSEGTQRPAPGFEYEIRVSEAPDVVEVLDLTGRVTVGTDHIRDSNGAVLRIESRSYLGRYLKGDQIGCPSGYGVTRTADFIQRAPEKWGLGLYGISPIRCFLLCAGEHYSEVITAILSADIDGFLEDTERK